MEKVFVISTRWNGLPKLVDQKMIHQVQVERKKKTVRVVEEPHERHNFKTVLHEGEFYVDFKDARSAVQKLLNERRADLASQLKELEEMEEALLKQT